MRTLGGESFPASAAEEFLVFAVGEFGVGDGDFTVNAFEELLFRGVGGLEELVDLGVNQGVDATDEEASDAGDVGVVEPLGGASFESSDVGLGDLFVSGLSEEEGDVDV